MALLKILHFPDPRLRTVAKPVAQIDATTRQIVADMLETMYQSKGIGLAATQVNIHQQIIVIDISEEHNQPLCLINPIIQLQEGSCNGNEGCLSVPEIFEPVNRAERIIVAAQNAEGEHYQIDTNGLLAICIQHEIDHLKGKLFVDYLSPLKRDRIRKKIEKNLKEAS